MTNCRKKTLIPTVIIFLSLFVMASLLFADFAKTEVKNPQQVGLQNPGPPSVNEIPAGHSATTSLITIGDFARTRIKNRQRVDLRNLGLSLVNEIPTNSSAITSLLAASNGKVYGGTSGEQAYLFMFDPGINKVRHLGKVKDQAGIHHALAEDKNGCIYIGTSKSILDEIKMHQYGPDHPSNPTEDLIDWRNVETDFEHSYPDHVRYEMNQSGAAIGYQYLDMILWNDIKNHFKDYPGGHLYRYNPKKSDRRVKLPDMECELEDLGIPVPKNSIYALTVSPEGDVIYGLTYPDGHFFIYDITGKKFKDMGEIDKDVTFHGPERHWRSLPRALICDDSGRVYTSSTDGALVYYCPHSEKILSTGLAIPSDRYHAHISIDYAVVEYFAKDSSGLIYGGSSDGYLFSFNPNKTELINLGKLRVPRRLRCLAVGKDGKVYMIAGERMTSRPCQFYSYNPQNGGFQDLGLLIADRSPHYRWRGYQFDCMTTGNDGTIFIGESEYRSHLFIYIP